MVAPQTLLEVRLSAVGLWPKHSEFLLLRVTGDGQVEYEEEEITDVSEELVLRKSNLSPEQLKDLTDFLNAPELRNAAAEYEPDVSTIDHLVTFKIIISRHPQPQVIALKNFRPSYKTKDKYPMKLVELVCKIQRLRANKRDNCRILTAL